MLDNYIQIKAFFPQPKSSNILFKPEKGPKKQEKQAKTG